MSQATNARMVVECRDFDATLEYFTDRLGFRLDRISPADDPREADLSGHGLGLLLRRAESDSRGSIRLVLDDAAASLPEGLMTAPNGTVIEVVRTGTASGISPMDQSLVVSRLADDPSGFGAGRAGMAYRDLIPGRQGGRFIASHIRIENGGEVADYVHFHKIRFQLIFCHEGWVRVAYEDQGDPLVMRPGDCVLQPPEIRHQVLESSPGLEVVEVGCPAEHDTFVDHELALPSGSGHRHRDFGGQRFVHHVAAQASWQPSRVVGFEVRETEIAEATNGMAGVRVLRSTGPESGESEIHDGEFLFRFVRHGTVDVVVDGRSEPLRASDSVVIPAGSRYSLVNVSPDAEILEVSLPAVLPLR